MTISSPSIIPNLSTYGQCKSIILKIDGGGTCLKALQSHLTEATDITITPREPLGEWDDYYAEDMPIFGNVTSLTVNLVHYALDTSWIWEWFSLYEKNETLTTIRIEDDGILFMGRKSPSFRCIAKMLTAFVSLPNVEFCFSNCFYDKLLA